MQPIPEDFPVAYNFVPCDRDQQYLLPPSLSDWLPADHLAFFILDAVAQMDVSAFYAAYRADGWGRAAYRPEMMVALLLYAYCQGERSSRQIERRCREDVAYRVICANQVPDHTTICRFRQDHQEAVAGIFTEVLRLLAEAGMVRVGTLALDGTKMGANASLSANRTGEALEQEIREILREAEAADQEEDRHLGPQARGDEPPEGLRDPADRLRRLREAKARLDRETQAREEAYQARLRERAAEEARRGRKLKGRKPKPPDSEEAKAARANTTDPDSRIMRDHAGYLQGYNAQAVVTCDQVVVAASVTDEANDVGQLHPMVAEARENLEAAGVEDRPTVVLCDAGYFSEANLEDAPEDGPELLIATTKDWRQRKAALEKGPPRGRIPKDLSARERMERKLRTKRGQALYRRRAQIVEPPFGQTKENRGARRFIRRGLQAADSEWKLILATHNLLKLWRSGRMASKAPLPGRTPAPIAA